ncbi:hypothetical protein IV454_07460 [Massilia antarctica]|uniref:Penicillin-binding protein activator LpoB n=1 Tax=Massilia antarctica TaxID=2765360 RepID=A0AA49A980_9BURK|nr:hypothetical protein [Massilia antarctica]QPI51348.1 hypothetical protein IV454_07460 [Massilia antarctica]
MTSIFRLTSLVAAGALAVQLVGCAPMSMSVPAATMENAVKLRNADFDKVAVGSFTLDASKNASLDKSHSIRASTVVAPGGSFAQYLGETLKAELLSASLLDANAPTVITGTLTQTDVDAAIGTGKGVLAARFVVTRAAQVRYDRELKVESSWESSFIGATAIPLAAREYELQYRKLIGELLGDEKFRAAISK